MRALPDGDVTFLLTDIEGSTALFRALGPQWEPLLATHNNLLRDAVAHAAGVELKSGGDGFIFAFADPTAALAAAIDGQRAIAARDWGPHEIRVRMGVHRGEAKVVDDDYVSFALHQAARILSAANGGQVIVSPSIQTPAPGLAGVAELRGSLARAFDDHQAGGPGGWAPDWVMEELGDAARDEDAWKRGYERSLTDVVNTTSA